MKKILLTLILGMFLISCVSAFEFDDILTYTNNDLKATINNCDFWLLTCLNEGEVIGSIELKSHSSVTEIRKVHYGKEEVVMYYDFYDWELYKNGLGEVTFTNLTNDELIDRDYYFVEWVLAPVTRYVYDNVKVGISENGSTIYEYKVVNTYEEDEWQWKNYTSKDIPNRNTRIGLKTYVEKGDKVDGKWTIAGKLIEKHAGWEEDWNTGLKNYFKMEGTSGAVIDSINNNNGTIFGTVARGVPGKIGNAFNVTTTGANYVNVSTTAVSQYVWNFWIKNSSIPETWAGGIEAQLGGNWGILVRRNLDTNYFMHQISGGSALYGDVTTVIDGTWHMVTATYNGSHIGLYVDGASINSTTQTGVISIDYYKFFESEGGATWSGYMDEVAFWLNDSLTDAEILGIYDAQKDGFVNGSYTADFPPSVTIDFPLNTTYNETITQLNYTEDGTSVRCWNSIDGGTTNSSDVVAGVNFTNLYSVSKLNGWTVFCNNSGGEVGQDVVYFTLNTSVGTNIIAPVNTTRFNVTTINLTIKGIPVNTNLTNISVSVWYSNGTLALTNSTTLTGNVDNQTNFTSIFGDGVYIWYAETNGVNVTTNRTANNTFEIHTTASSVIISYPKGTINHIAIGNNLTLNWTVQEPGQNLTAHVKNCSYTYNGVTTYFNNTICTEINTTSFLYVYGVNNLTFTVEEDFNLTTTNSTSWSFKIIENSQTYSNTTTEGATETFAINFTQAGVQTSTASLIYNNTEYSGTFSISDGIVLATTNLTIPNYDAIYNISFYWSILLSDDTIINTSSNNQTVSILAIDNCSIYTTLIYNYTLYDEEMQTKLLNTTIEIQLNLLNLDKTISILNFSREYDDINPAQICLNVNLTNENYKVDSIAKYNSNSSGTPYAIEYYNIVGETLNNGTIPRNINLYNLKLDDSTEFQLTFKDSNLAFAPGVLVQIHRQYIADNDYKIVEIPITDSSGQTILHLVRNDIIYNFVMVDSEGNILATFNQVTAFCQDYTIGECTIKLNAPSTPDTLYNYTDDLGITYTAPTFSNTTGLVAVSFTSNDLSPVTVKMEIVKNSEFGNRTVCTDSLTSSTGILNCNVSTIVSTDRFLFVKLYVGGDLKSQFTIDLEQDAFNFGIVNGAFYAFLMLLFIITMFIDDRQTLILSLVIGWTAIISMGLIKGTLFGVLSGGTWLIVCAIIFLWKLRKEEKF